MLLMWRGDSLADCPAAVRYGYVRWVGYGCRQPWR